MRFEFSALPWELLGQRPAMITCTYPKEWELYVPNARVLVAHREALKERWRKRFGPPVGVWVVEFQSRGAPHLHLYVALPEAVSPEDYAGLQARTMRRKRREHDVGAYEARRTTPPVSGEFGEWLRTAWWEIVGSGLPAHEKRGIDVAVAFFSERAEGEADRVRVAEYFWRESGKWAQKKPPEGFGSLKFYGRWGAKLGFAPVASVEVLNEMVAMELRRMLRRLMLAKMRAEAKRTGRRVTRRTGRSRGRDGLTVFGVDGIRLGPAMMACAEKSALDKASAVGMDRKRPYDGGPAWRALPELELLSDEDGIPVRAWDDGPAEDALAPPPDWYLHAEVEAYLARQDEEHAEIGAAIRAEEERLRRINAVRASNGLPPRRPPKRLRIVLPNPPGRERKAR
jgi:hypothetical protein